MTVFFKDKYVLITGAGGGLGAALARRLDGFCAGMAIASRSMAALEERMAGLEYTDRIVPIIVDLSAPGEASRLAGLALEAMGRVDVLFNAAGPGYFYTIEGAAEEDIRYMFEVNVFAPLMLIKALLPGMKARGEGRIVNVVSCAGRVPIPGAGVRGGAKSALASMTDTMRLELEPFGIEVVNIYPDAVASSFEDNALRDKKRTGFGPPRHDIVDKVLKAAAGKPGEVWLDGKGRRMAVLSAIWPRLADWFLTGMRNYCIEEQSLKPRRWRLLQVETALACNLKCLMCPWTDFREKAGNKGLMAEEVWRGILPHLREVQSVDFTGGGEPLLQPKLAQWVAQAKEAGCETGILTNGLLLNKEKSRKLLEAGLDWICVSMDGADADVYEEIRRNSDFDRVCRNLENFLALGGKNKTRTMINFVIMSLNAHQLEDMVRLAARLGVDQVNFKQCDVIRDGHGKGYGLFRAGEDREARRLRKDLRRAEKLAAGLGLRTTSFPFTPDEMPVCDQDPRDSMFIRFDGRAAPCINLAVGGRTSFLGRDVDITPVQYGRLPEESLADIWESGTCRHYRRVFGERMESYERVYLQSLTGGSKPGPERIKKAALEAMPEAPHGCRVCHYLYGI